MYNLIEYSSNYSKITVSLWFYSKDEAADFSADIANTYNLRYFMFKTKLLENKVAERGNRKLKNITIAVPLIYFINFLRSFEMPLINRKIERKLKWTKYYVLAAAGADNANKDSNNIIFTIKDTKLCVPVVTLLLRYNQKLSNLLSKGFERSVY